VPLLVVVGDYEDCEDAEKDSGDYEEEEEEKEEEGSCNGAPARGKPGHPHTIVLRLVAGLRWCGGSAPRLGFHPHRLGEPRVGWPEFWGYNPV